VERVTRPAEVYEEHGEGGQECEGEETGEVREKTGDNEEIAGEATGNVGEQTRDDEGNAGYESLRLRKKDSFIHPGSAKKLRPHNGFIEHRVNYFTDSCDKRDKTPDGLRRQ
jgi:hypothetical protein